MVVARDQSGVIGFVGALGLEEGVLLEMISKGAAQSQMAEQWPVAEHAISRHTTNLWAKDLRLCLATASGLDLDLPATEQVQRLIERIARD